MFYLCIPTTFRFYTLVYFNVYVMLDGRYGITKLYMIIFFLFVERVVLGNFLAMFFTEAGF